jgi:PBP1b-binding outer membrane lipoprotein LpoB
MKTYTLIAMLVALLAGCSSPAPAPQKEVQANLTKTVDCSTATADIKTLTSEKESFSIGTGEYNKKLDAKISEIKQQCNIQ